MMHGCSRPLTSVIISARACESLDRGDASSSDVLSLAPLFRQSACLSPNQAARPPAHPPEPSDSSSPYSVPPDSASPPYPYPPAPPALDPALLLSDPTRALHPPPSSSSSLPALAPSPPPSLLSEQPWPLCYSLPSQTTPFPRHYWRMRKRMQSGKRAWVGIRPSRASTVYGTSKRMTKGTRASPRAE